MKRILTLLAFVTVGVVASVPVAQAEVTTNERTTLAYAGYVDCANDGAGEVLSGTVGVHDLVTSKVNGNNVSWQFLFQTQGGGMVGAITGDTYRVAVVTHGVYHESLDSDHYTLTYVNSFRLIGPGSGNNLLVREIAHVTIDGNENVVVRHDDLIIDCK